MRARSYWAPLDIATGVHAYQPHGAQMQRGWQMDCNRRWQDTGFLDAPAYLPTGATRALDCSNITLGAAHQPRDGTFA